MTNIKQVCGESSGEVSTPKNRCAAGKYWEEEWKNHTQVQNKQKNTFNLRQEVMLTKMQNMTI